MLTPDEKKHIDKIKLFKEVEESFATKRDIELLRIKKNLDKYVDQKNTMCDFLEKTDFKNLDLTEEQEIILKEACCKVVRDSIVNIQNTKISL